MNARTFPRIVLLLALAASISSCGAGGHKGSVSQLPPSIRYPQTSGFVVGASITALRPFVSGKVTGGYTASPPLPPGLTIDRDIGTIYGTPTAPAPTTIYRVDAMSPDGIVSTTVSLTVRDLAPRISYAPGSWTFTQNVAISSIISPNSTGGAVVTWSIDPTLPAGLVFDTGNGTISGTPTTPSAQASYQVTATNSGGTTSASLTITVLAASGSGGARLRAGARTTAADFVGIAGTTTAVQSGSWLMVSQKGTQLAGIEIPAAARWWQLAADGSYIVAATDSRLVAWSPSGAVLFSRMANYGDADVFAAAGELRVGAGPAGDQVIETIAVPSGAARLGPVYQGSFRSWSEDGESFIAAADEVLWSYSRDAAHREIATSPVR